MSIRVSEAWTARNGHRRWVSMSLAELLALSAAGFLLAAPFWLLWRLLLAEVWIAAECALLLATAVLAVVAVVRHEARCGEVTMTRLRFGLWMVDVR